MSRTQELFSHTVAFLRDGHGSQADFMASIDHVKCAIDLIEKERDYWKAKSKEYDAEMQMLIPQFSAKITTNYDDHQLMNVYTLFVQTELPYYRMSLSSVQLGFIRNQDMKLFRRFRWKTYLGYCREIRKRLDTAFANVK